MKITNLKQKIKINALIAILMFISIISVAFFYNYFDTNFQSEKSQLTDDIFSIKSKISEIESKAQENNKYKEIWKKTSSKKKLSTGIKNEEVEKIRNNLAQKYFINDSKLKMNVPENLPNNIFKNEALDILYTEGELTFLAYNDVKAIQFAEEFYKSLHGYVVFKNFEIKREKKYEAKDLKEISTGKNQGHITGKIEFAWYVFKENKNKENANQNPLNKTPKETTNENTKNLENP
jgi:hypothetical protein